MDGEFSLFGSLNLDPRSFRLDFEITLAVYDAAGDLQNILARGKQKSKQNKQGKITGDSLTFFTHDDRVLVGSKESSHTLIQTRIRDASKK